jgi:hypothetical protein
MSGAFRRTSRQAGSQRGGPGIREIETKMTLDLRGSKPRMGFGKARPHTVGAPMRDFLRQDETPPVAASAAEDEAEQRRAPRFTLLIRAAKLISPTDEFLCVVRDASESGVSVRLFHPLPKDIPLSLEMPNGDCLALERVWEEEGKAGFRFAGRVDIDRIVDCPSRFSRRAVRVKVEVPCDLLVGVRRARATIHNLSQQGALITTPDRLSLIQRVRLSAEGMPEIAAKVRWRRGESYGLSFEDTFQFAELAALAFELRRSA